jgi:5-methylcytosine-specific restriction endonuclease McrA
MAIGYETIEVVAEGVKIRLIDGIVYPRLPVAKKFCRYILRPHQNGRCIYCGKKLKGRQKSWCCSSHAGNYYYLWSIEGFRDRHRLINGNTCEKCFAFTGFWGEEGELDHIIPVALGGLNVDYNFQWLCRECHRQKTNEDMIVIMGWKGNKADDIRPIGEYFEKAVN